MQVGQLKFMDDSNIATWTNFIMIFMFFHEFMKVLCYHFAVTLSSLHEGNNIHTGEFPAGVGHRVESGCSFVKWSHMVKNDIYPKTTLIYGHFELWSKKKLALAIS